MVSVVVVGVVAVSEVVVGVVVVSVVVEVVVLEVVVVGLIISDPPNQSWVKSRFFSGFYCFFSIEMGTYSHPCKEQMVCKSIQKQQVPKFNRRIFLQNKTEVGTVDEIFGPVENFVSSIDFSLYLI